MAGLMGSSSCLYQPTLLYSDAPTIKKKILASLTLKEIFVCKIYTKNLLVVFSTLMPKIIYLFLICCQQYANNTSDFKKVYFQGLPHITILTQYDHASSMILSSHIPLVPYYHPSHHNPTVLLWTPAASPPPTLCTWNNIYFFLKTLGSISLGHETTYWRIACFVKLPFPVLRYHIFFSIFHKNMLSVFNFSKKYQQDVSLFCQIDQSAVLL